MGFLVGTCLGLVMALGINAAAAGESVVSGFDVEVYATMPFPGRLAFDPDGILYVGNGDISGAGAVKIRRVGLGGAPVEEYGDTGLADPDSVAFDASGAISGTPGSVLVGDGGTLVAILPDETTVDLLSGLGNLAYLDFDRTARLMMADQAPPFRLLATTGGPAIQLGGAFKALTVDGANRIYAALLKGQVTVTAPDGTFLSELTIRDSELGFLIGLEFGPYDSLWKGELIAIDNPNSDLYRIAPDGTITLLGIDIAPDFGSSDNDVAFGPDGALYVSSRVENVVYRVTPAEVTFVPTDDAKLRSRSASKNFGRSGNLRVRHDEWESCLRFQVTTPSSDSATLRLYATDGSPDGGTIYQAENDWAESSVSYSSKPAIVSGPLDSAGAVFDDTWVELDVSSVVTGAGTYSFCLVSDSSNSVFYSSRERSQAPELVVEFEY